MIALQRNKNAMPAAMWGQLFVDGHQKAVTIENPEKIIPAGTWVFTRYLSPKHGQVWVAIGIPDRTYIEIHEANWARQLDGCIGVGDQYGYLENEPAVLHSDTTLQQLRGILPDTFTLTIIDPQE